ncbi:MAG TPA: hypothetical protein VG245_09050 [Candidatus Dormibacteraeota bacterium]|jgi:hypothetical protein|nr:hypothetical protein [Candidatus Dormibacteraeota bacterium]
MDRDGYGYGSDDHGVPRLLEDLRTLSPAGIERIAAGWQRIEEVGALDRFHDAERAALRALEEADLGPRWDEVKRQVLDLTEGRSSLVAWRAEHGEIGHRAEAAALGAVLALVATGRISGEDLRALVEPMAESLPWLLTAV